MSDVTLPALGESVTEGTVTRWLKAVGDSVAVDEPLVEISTDKVDTEIPSPVAGVVQEILVAEDETVEVGAVLARVGEAVAATGAGASPEPVAQPAAPEPTPEVAPAPTPEPASAPATEVSASAPAAHTVAAPPPPAPAPAAAAPATSEQPSAPASDDAGDASYVTPIVRKLAQQHGVDLSTLTGTGVGGRIRKEDVLAASRQSPPTAAAPTPESVATPAAPAPAVGAPAEVSELRGTSQPMSRLRKVIAKRAVASMQETAQLTSVVEADVTEIGQLRSRVQEVFVTHTGGKLSFLPFFVRAAAEALQSHPIINATVEGESIIYPAHENISIAVDTERGLLTPVLRDAAGKTIVQISRDIADLAERTRNNTLHPDELAGGTFTVTNTGSRGALFDTPVVFLPQVAIMGTGIVQKKPVVVSHDGDDAIAVRQMVYLSLSYDHRIVDGADAARFLSQVKSRLEHADFDSVMGL